MIRTFAAIEKVGSGRLGPRRGTAMADSGTTTTAEVGAPQKLSFMTMTAMVVGSMVGAGVFSLPRRFAQETGVAGALIAWVIAGAGMLMLAFVFQYLAVRRPDLDAGVYAYAKAGFGEYLGFFSAFGYWASACVGNVTYWVLIKSTLGAAIPAFGEGNTVIAVALSSVGVWAFHFFILRGVKEAAGINKVVTIAKIIPLLVFLGAAAFAFMAAKNDDMPAFLKRTNPREVPAAALLMTTLLIQLVLLVTLFSDDAFTFTLKLTSALNLVPYVFAAAYALKLGITRETYENDPASRKKQTLIAFIATAYTVFMLFA